MCCSIYISGENTEHAKILTEMGASYDKRSGAWQIYPAFTTQLKELEQMGIPFKMEHVPYYPKDGMGDHGAHWSGD